MTIKAFTRLGCRTYAQYAVKNWAGAQTRMAETNRPLFLRAFFAAECPHLTVKPLRFPYPGDRGQHGRERRAPCCRSASVCVCQVRDGGGGGGGGAGPVRDLK